MKSLSAIFFILFVILIATTPADAQYDQSKINKKAVEAHNKAFEKYQDGRISEALALLQQALAKAPEFIDPYLFQAKIYSDMKDYKKSIVLYEKAFSLDSNYTSEYRLPYSICLAGLGEFEKALQAINALLSKSPIAPNTKKAAEFRQETYHFAVDFAQKNPAKDYVFRPVNLGEGVNSPESEFFPSLPINGKELIFTRRLNNINEDFFYSQKEGSTWGAAHRLTGSINTPQNEGAQVISQDGQWLVFTGCNREGGLGGCDIFMSYLTPQGWSEAINLGNRINTEHWDSQPCLSPDKRDLYFASRRPGGFGGSDIYVAHLQPNGRWSTPENMGDSINTNGDEFCPFIHADNETLYFTSNSWPGYGKDDLFMARKDAGGKWSTPKNLGYPINTIDNEGSLFITGDGVTAYYASDRSDSRGGLDLYSFELRQDVRPRKTLWVKGVVFDKRTKAGLPSAVELVDLSTKQTVSKVQTDETGNFFITLPVGRDYAFNVARKGYLFYSDNFLLSRKAPDSTYEKNIPLQPININASVVLKNIFFDFNKYELKPESQVELDHVVRLLNDNPTVKIQIAGHTDNIGNAADNLRLSENRSKSVIGYLVSKGINAKRLSYKGFGATQPVASNDSDEGRAMNRRTELKITEK